MTAYNGITLAVIAIVAFGTMMYTYFNTRNRAQQTGYHHDDVPPDDPYMSDRYEDIPETSSRRKRRRNNDNCTICFDTFEGRRKTRTLICEHVFHEHCIEMWLSHNKSCPVCRTAVS